MTARAGLTLDAGALIAIERGDRRVRALLARVGPLGLAVAVPAGVLAQAWRGGPRQARVAALLSRPGIEVVPLEDLDARAIGLLCGRAGHPDVIDGSVALCAAERNHAVVTSDPGDIGALDSRLQLIVV